MNSKWLQKYGSLLFLVIVFAFMAFFRHDIDLTDNEERMTENYFDHHVGDDSDTSDDIITSPEEDAGTES
ncbi:MULTISPECIES: hypothetical protein [Alteribacter]|uniref:Uncharacterized protein n=1 Tax=Alteribacter keqinensis TaxID=2483800 RepID=A0A3M7TRG6_9BACI|nr:MULTISPECIES: hypothetical protein [Alteribacter]MBM7095630.1 hypothetical protein [Alteribacter salitolerans]RNA67779.1 hypothetical protein EBO34_13805 [Alteribacter keqinensis]